MSKKTRTNQSNRSNRPSAAWTGRSAPAKTSARPRAVAKTGAIKKSAAAGAAKTAKTAKAAVRKSRSAGAGTPHLAEGQQAPAFTLPRDGGGRVSLSDFAGQKLVIFFYPRAGTPGCTLEAAAFSRLHGAFAAAGTAVLGVSADPVKVQESFRTKHKLKVPLLSDEGHEMLEAYGVWGEKKLYGKSFMGILRTTVLIGPDGRIARVWRNVKVEGHAEEVLAVAQAL